MKWQGVGPAIFVGAGVRFAKVRIRGVPRQLVPLGADTGSG
jgi:hypothetical protein